MSLLAFRESIKVLGINRDYSTQELLKCYGSKNRNCNEESNNSSQTKKRKLVDPMYEKLFTKSVKKKKRHEIENIAEVRLLTGSYIAYKRNDNLQSNRLSLIFVR